MTDQRSTGHRPRLLILDDDPLIGKTIEQVANYYGFAAHHVVSALDFFDELSSWSPDVVALDLIMPGMDGVEVISALSKMATQVPIIITSGVGSRVLDAAERSAKAHGLKIAGVLPKPFAAVELRQLLDYAVADCQKSADPIVSSATPEPVAPTAADLEAALRQRQLTLVYQPKVHCRTGALVGFEALCRWNHPALGAISPDIFIPLAEENGLIDELTIQVMESALIWLANMSDDKLVQKTNSYVLKQATLSINISAKSLSNSRLFEDVVTRCRSYQLSPARIILEITETSAMQDAMLVLDNLTRLRLQGFQLSLDDFGTGYSSMVQLVKLPFSEIKVDKSFVIDAPESTEACSVVRSVVELGRSLGLKSTAEGVETDAAMALLRNIGCDYAQGFGIARPLLPETVVNWVVERQAALEQARQRRLVDLQLLDTPAEERFDRITRLARRLFGVKGAVVSLVDSGRLWVKSQAGVSMVEVPRDIGFCDATLDTDGCFVVSDTKKNPDFRDNPLVTGSPYIIFYAGIGLVVPSGEKVGLFCLLDSQPRLFLEQEKQQFSVLAKLLENQLVAYSSDRLDPQTGYVNRDSYYREAASLLQVSHRLEVSTTIISIKVHNLVQVNHRYGRVAGDKLLKATADILSKVVEDADLVGRRRGKEIAALILAATDDDIEKLCEQLALRLQQWNSDQENDQPLLSCDVVTTQVMPGKDDAVEKILKAEWTLRAAINE